jgi:hypothetical protein
VLQALATHCHTCRSTARPLASVAPGDASPCRGPQGSNTVQPNHDTRQRTEEVRTRVRRTPTAVHHQSFPRDGTPALAEPLAPHHSAPFALTVDPVSPLMSWRFSGSVSSQADPQCRGRGWRRAPTQWRCSGGHQWILSGRSRIWSLTGSPCLGCAPPHPFHPCPRRLAPTSLHFHRSVRVANLLTLDLGSGAPPLCDWKT